MNAQEKIDLLRERFIHKDDTYVRQWQFDGKTGYARIEEPLTDKVVYQHLTGKETISVFPIASTNTVKWMCFDVDINGRGKRELDNEQVLTQTRQQTKRVAAVLFHHSIPFRVEDSGSKGYHVWVFFDAPVPTHKAHDVAHYLHTHFPLNDYVNVEVMPQHRSANDVQYSKAVKLPLGIHKKTRRRCFFVNGSFEPHTNQWEILTKIHPMTEAELDRLIVDHQIVQTTTVSTQHVNTQDYICFSRMMQEGLEDGARDVGLFQLACYYRMQGLPPDMADILLNEVNNKSPNPLDADTVQRKRVSAYDREYYPSPCRESQFDSYCSTACRRWDRKVQTRWTRYGRDAEDAKGVIGT